MTKAPAKRGKGAGADDTGSQDTGTQDKGTHVTGTQLQALSAAVSLIRRSLRETGRHASGPGPLLDCLRIAPDRVLAFFGTGTDPAVFVPDGAADCALPLDLRAISGGTLATFEAPAPESPETRGPEADQIGVALATGDVLELTAEPTETEPLAGRNCLLGFRLEESAAQTAEWLAHHARHQGIGGAVLVNRLPDDNFAGALEAALTDAFAGTSDADTLGMRDFRLILLDSPLPLGKPGMPPENHPILAPDAPGKDRMEQPEPDPWRAPLGEGLLYELVKWRFLAAARTVMCLDPSDYLPPPGEGPTAADQCAASKSGVIWLAGRRVYPWRVRPGAEPRMADHICAPFDLGQPMLRWAVAPEKAGLVNTWRMTRIAYIRPDPGPAPVFFRAMAIRVPGRAASELAPKTSLVEDPALLTLSEQVFGHKPVRPPVSKPRKAPRAATEAGRTAIVTTMKNEGPFILEWLAYHRAIGVDDFLIYTNDCSDGTDTMLDLLQRKGIVQHRDNPFRDSGLKPQHAALQAAESEPVMHDCGWGICMDVDEFINIRIGDGTLAALYDAMGNANMISLTWRLFGNAEVHDFQDRFLLDQFTRCAPEVIRKPHQAWGFKTLFRNIDIYKKLGVHRPKGLIPDLWDRVTWLNGSGRPMPRTMFRNGWRSSLETYGYDWVQLNHYAVRSAESFLVKRDRGRVNHVDRDQGLNYWFRMNHNLEEDRSIQRMIPRLQVEFDRLMADPEIRAAHEHSVRCHCDKITELRATENYERFYGELTGARMERLCRMQRHFGSAVFSAGPGVIPPDLHLQDLPEDFFFTVEHSGEQEH
ncbi:glycosyltransferase family 2 protein [Szabonella alba]|uniref:Glycosyltransferase family 2 protein n=1 Tax=Szabonella alba TaxID=2804194 RepID=A0A8K0XZZ4_9RHOB|nr:glycosyltransferase family 2 protein [Szabonella alba]MBL4917655.1 glycosyltransferase family 2 protein [Szabonella alba]